MKPILIVLLVLLALLQYKLWFAPGGVTEVWQLKANIAKINAENATWQERNAVLAAQVQDLKQGNGAIEEQARTDLGMIKKGETFYQIVK